MDFFTDNILLILFLPIWIGLIILSGVFFKLTENRKMTTFITILSTLTGLIFSTTLLNKVTTPIENTFKWFSTDELTLTFGTYLDTISITFLSVLMVISLLVQIYSYGYMKDTKGFNRYFIYLNFFNFAMTGLILSPNLIQLYIFWELVGVASYLLIGFFYEKDDVSKSAKKVFIINRIGDISFLLGVIILTYFPITYMNGELLTFGNIENFYTQMLGLTYPSTYNLILGLLLFGAFVKSAQFPFQQWLIDAMKAPTPVSALIHSATMVCAGIFLIIRIYPLLNDELLKIILFTGLITAVLCAFIALTQNNIKKMLAYSTASQLGLMFVAIGLKSIPIAIVYLVIHSFTKASLFLCTGNISKITNTIEMNEITGIRKYNSYLALYWVVAGLSLAGLFFGGFTSKEMLINLAEERYAILFLVLLTSFMSAYYIFRSYFKIFEGDKKEYNIKLGRSMSLPIAILTILIVFPGFIFKISMLNMLCILSIAIGISAIVSAYYSNKCNRIALPTLLYKLSEKELFIPNIYDFIGKVFSYFFNFVYLFEKYIIDGTINLIGKTNKILSKIISKLQNGNIQTYVSYSVFSIGIILLVVLYFYFMAARG